MLIVRLPGSPPRASAVGINFDLLKVYQASPESRSVGVTLRSYAYRYAVPANLAPVLPLILREQFPLAPLGSHPAIHVEAKRSETRYDEKRNYRRPYMQEISFVNTAGVFRELIHYEQTTVSSSDPVRTSTFSWPTAAFGLVNFYGKPIPAFIGIHTRSTFMGTDPDNDFHENVAFVFVAFPYDTTGHIHPTEDGYMARLASGALNTVDEALRFRLFGAGNYARSASIVQMMRASRSPSRQGSSTEKGPAELRKIFGKSTVIRYENELRRRR